MEYLAHMISIDNSSPVTECHLPYFYFLFPYLLYLLVVGTSFSASVVEVVYVANMDRGHDGRAKAGPYDLPLV